ncbi:hypothetical protein [Aestuariispira insulae]|uniref:Uncharacterized protein n=1 Tax=Aestuariispira insulae TaxID=1461337 RepID=A0A3D9H5Z4_9PROT|nr:hypothetical protein [Aestuariispira insulae]RED44859.1 hypothetical protein DFP90_11364 [Aestuariispira insulae]
MRIKFLTQGWLRRLAILIAVAVSLIGLAAYSQTGSISLNSPVSFPVDI